MEAEGCSITVVSPLSDEYFLDYVLPPERIAQEPITICKASRAESKLLVARSTPTLEVEDSIFSCLPSLLRRGDLVVLNDTRVCHRRFFTQLTGKAGEVEIFLVEKRGASSGGEYWEAIGRPLRKFRVGEEIELSKNLLARVESRDASLRRMHLEISAVSDSQTVAELIEADGSIPIPPYIRKGHATAEDAVTYQTVYARQAGSIAAPTAGLHFTKEIFREFDARGIGYTFLTLHVGAASFTPVENVATHEMETECFVISRESREKIAATRENSGCVVAVGTTSARALESDNGSDEVQETRLFIRPGFVFKKVDALITNFHQPRSSHLLLVQAFIGKDETATIYQQALNSSYRFLSYGDAMLLEKRGC